MLKPSLADPVAMWHVRDEISLSILFVVDFGGWFRQDSKSSNGSSFNFPERIQHTQVSVIKDMIVPYTHLLPRLDLSHNKRRRSLLYFKGAKHRHRVSLMQREESNREEEEKLRVLFASGRDAIELPFEGTIYYSEFSVFVSVNDALRPKWLAIHLRKFTDRDKETFRSRMATVQTVFVYENGQANGIGPIRPDGAVNQIWKKVKEKVPMLKEAVTNRCLCPSEMSMYLKHVLLFY
ncbi:unnamed protein product [Cochlearia groenlandica]